MAWKAFRRVSLPKELLPCGPSQELSEGLPTPSLEPLNTIDITVVILERNLFFRHPVERLKNEMCSRNQVRYIWHTFTKTISI